MVTVLVVDDSAVDRSLISGMLNRQTGWEVEQAENGVEALTRLNDGGADVVVTDLNMPEMDGLDLVRAVRVQHPFVPVVLITGQGSEALAIEALEQGAASYVPKSKMNEMLVDTIEQVLALVRADRSYAKLIECVNRTEFNFALENDPGLIDPLVDLMQQMVSGMGVCDAIWRVRLGVALEQALLNALFHGNLEISAEQMLEARESMMEGKDEHLIAKRRAEAPYSERRIHVDVRLTPEEARFVVRDEGPGFDTSTVPASGDAAALEREGGRGLVLMRTFMDEVVFNDAGNEVTMVKRRRKE